MRYFTQEMIARGQSQDDKVVNEVEALWDEACERYSIYLDSVKPDMPPGLRHRVDSYYLHDAVIQGMGRQGNSFVIVLQLDTPPQSLITFTYDLVAEPIIQQNTLPPEAGAPGKVVEWQYDEIERLPGDPVSWAQTILLSNGWEVKLHFRDVAVQEVQSLLPVPRTPPPPVSQSA